MLFLAMAIAVPAAGESPFVADLAGFFRRYHEDPPHLDVIRAGLVEGVKTDPNLPNLLALAQVCFIWGDIRATTDDQKLEAYDEGRQAAQRAVGLAPQNPLAHFWYAVNLARWGQNKGVLRSLLLLPTVKKEVETVLRLDPGLVAAYALAGNVFSEVPSILGGDLEAAERLFRKGLSLDPHFTGMRVGLARTLIKGGRRAEARRELDRVLSEKKPENLADWTLKDSPEARLLLASIDRGSQ